MLRRTSKNKSNNLDPFFEEYRKKERKKRISLIISLSVCLVAVGGIFFSDELGSISFNWFSSDDSTDTEWTTDNSDTTSEEENQNSPEATWETVEYTDQMASNTAVEDPQADLTSSPVEEPAPAPQEVEEIPVEPAQGVTRGSDPDENTSTPAEDSPPLPLPQVSSPDKIHKMVDEMPSFPGGNRAMKRFFDQNLDKSILASLPDGKINKVWLQFVVEPNGEISTIQIVQGLNEQANREAVRLLQNMPSWEPGKLEGERVRVYYTISVNFANNS